MISAKFSYIINVINDFIFQRIVDKCHRGGGYGAPILKHFSRF